MSNENVNISVIGPEVAAYYEGRYEGNAEGALAIIKGLWLLNRTDVIKALFARRLIVPSLRKSIVNLAEIEMLKSEPEEFDDRGNLYDFLLYEYNKEL